MSRLSVEKLEDRLDQLEDCIDDFRNRFTDKRMVDLWSKALRTEERHNKLDKIIWAIIIGFIVQSLMLIFTIILLITFAEPT